MGYACPVCGDPQADAEHLANHLAFTALRGDDEHEDWLATHAPDWDQHDAEGLAAVVADHAESVEFPQVFEDTTERDHDHDEERSGALFEDDTDLPAGSRDAVERERRDRDLDAQAEQALEDAREMTRQMLDDATAADDAAGTDGAPDADDPAGADDDDPTSESDSETE